MAGRCGPLLPPGGNRRAHRGTLPLPFPSPFPGPRRQRALSEAQCSEYSVPACWSRRPGAGAYSASSPAGREARPLIAAAGRRPQRVSDLRPPAG